MLGDPGADVGVDRSRRGPPGRAPVVAPAPHSAPRPLPGVQAGWALSPFDFQAHAVDRFGEHPFGVFIALCGHKMFDGALYDVPRAGCVPDAARSWCGAARRRTAGSVALWARSLDDGRCHAVDPVRVGHADEPGSPRRGADMPCPAAGWVIEDASSGPLCWRRVLGSAPWSPIGRRWSAASLQRTAADRSLLSTRTTKAGSPCRWAGAQRAARSAGLGHARDCGGCRDV